VNCNGRDAREATGIAYSHTDRDELEQRAAPQRVHPLLESEAPYHPTPVRSRGIDLVLKWEKVAEGRYKLALPEGARLHDPAGGRLHRQHRVQGWSKAAAHAPPRLGPLPMRRRG
jgi:hypothetical protein